MSWGRLPALCLVALFVLVWTSPPALAIIDVASLPKPTGYVSDLAHVLTPADIEQLDAFCTSVEQQLGVQFALVTIASVDDQPIEDFGIALSRKWGIGDRKTNQGALLLLAIRDHKSDIETGRGLEPYITDGFSGGTLRAMRPDLRAANYGAAMMMGARAMAQQIAQGKNITFASDIPAPLPPLEPSRQRSSGHLSLPLIFLGLFVLMWFLGGRRGGGGGGGGAGNFLTGAVLGSLLSGGNRRGGDWGGGGFGGDSGGSGGFGGFGGGDFGGGGASSDW